MITLNEALKTIEKEVPNMLVCGCKENKKF